MYHYDYLTTGTCSHRTTSCGDQLAKAVRRAYEAELAGEVQES